MMCGSAYRWESTGASGHYIKGESMKQTLGLGFGAVTLALAIGCGGSSSGSGNAGGASGASAGGTSSASGGSTSLAGSTSSGGSTSHAGSTSTSHAGSTSTGSTFSTTVPASTSLGSLSGAQLTELCAELQSYLSSGAFVSSATDYECKLLAVVSAVTATTDAAAQAACKASASACAADAGITTTTGQCTAPPASCTATVGELQACLNAYTTTFATLDASVPSCDGLTKAQALATLTSLSSDAGTGLSDPPACVTYQAKCPSSNMVPSPMGM